MAISTQLIGRLGGTKVESITIDYTESNSTNGDVETVATIPAPPEGKQWRVVVVVTSATATSSNSSWPVLTMGSTSAAYAAGFPIGLTLTVSGTTPITATRRSGVTTASRNCTGVAYYWEV